MQRNFCTYPLRLVVCLEPGNVEMRPGRRVSQLLNIAFDMAAWVKELLRLCTISADVAV